MTDLQALLTGAIAAFLTNNDVIAVEVEIQVDGEGNYEPWLRVTGRESGTVVVVRVEVVAA